jgi:hypothetical protein
MGGVERTRLGELTRVVWAECVAGDHEACGIVDRLAFEVLSFVRAAIGRLGLRDERVEVVLGGTLLRTAPPHLLDRVRGGLAVVAPEAVVIVPDSPPIAGAALLALDDLAADEEAKARARGALTEAAARLVDGDG